MRKSIDIIKHVVNCGWSLEITIGENCDYIFTSSWNNQPRKTKRRKCYFGTFSQCMTDFYRDWRKRKSIKELSGS